VAGRVGRSLCAGQVQRTPPPEGGEGGAASGGDQGPGPGGAGGPGARRAARGGKGRRTLIDADFGWSTNKKK